MSLSILNNIPSLMAQNSLSMTGASLTQTLQQLSTGSRINSGADDAAGLAIANGLQANITALTQSARNATDGVGSLQVADGALSQITSLLNRAVTLATEAATGTVSNSQRSSLDAEYQAIQAEITQIGSNTNYNGTAVFNNSLSVFLSDSVTNSPISASTSAVSAAGLLGGNGTATLAFSAVPANADTVVVGGTTYKFVTALSTGPQVANEVLIGSGGTAAQNLASSIANLAAAINGGVGAGTVYGSPTVANADATASVNGTSLVLGATAAGNALITGGGTIASTSSNAANKFLNGATFLGGATSDLTTANNAQAALTSINTAIATVANERGTLGAAINRLQAASGVMTNQVQNLTSAESGIMSADIGQVTANLSKFSILQQTGIAALQQSNQMQQSVLKLLQ